jgi:uncharacterized phage-like protein YoqJ
LEFQNERPVRLEAAIPYAGRKKCCDPEFQALLRQCQAVHAVSEAYFPGCFFARNRWMVERSDAVIAVYDGRRKGGSFYTIQYAKSMGKGVVFVHVEPA